MYEMHYRSDKASRIYQNTNAQQLLSRMLVVSLRIVKDGVQKPLTQKLASVHKPRDSMEWYHLQTSSVVYTTFNFLL